MTRSLLEYTGRLQWMHTPFNWPARVTVNIKHATFNWPARKPVRGETQGQAYNEAEETKIQSAHSQQTDLGDKVAQPAGRLRRQRSTVSRQTEETKKHSQQAD